VERDALEWRLDRHRIPRAVHHNDRRSCGTAVGGAVL